MRCPEWRTVRPQDASRARPAARIGVRAGGIPRRCRRPSGPPGLGADSSGVRLGAGANGVEIPLPSCWLRPVPSWPRNCAYCCMSSEATSTPCGPGAAACGGVCAGAGSARGVPCGRASTASAATWPRGWRPDSRAYVAMSSRLMSAADMSSNASRWYWLCKKARCVGVSPSSVIVSPFCCA